MADDVDAADSVIDGEDRELDESPDTPVDSDTAATEPRVRPMRTAALVGLIMCLSIAGLTAWLGMQVRDADHEQDRTAIFVQTARQVATNLTTIDYANADADVQRILASATGAFYDDFNQRAAPFIDVVRQAQSTSTGTVTEAGLESEQPDGAQVLVAVVVQSTSAGTEQPPRAWRMRLAVQMVGEEPKVAKVEFVP